MARSSSPRPPQRDNVVPLKRRPTGWWRAVAAAARLWPRRRDRAGTQQYRTNPFTAALPPPGVVPEGRPKVPQIAMDAAQAFAVAQDQFSGIGTVDPLGGGAGWVGGYANQYFASAYEEGQSWLGYAVLAILSQRPEYRVMTDTYATEMTREWVKFTSKSEDRDKQPRIDELEKRLGDLKLKAVTKTAIENDGFQGRGQIYIDTGDNDNPDELKTSIGSGGKDSEAKFGKPERGSARDNLACDLGPGIIEEPRDVRAPVLSSDLAAKRSKIKRLAAIEPMWCYPAQYNADDPLKPDWYRPEHWWVMGKEVHRTRLLTFVSNPVPDMLKPAYSFGGLSRTQMAKPYVDFYLRNRTSASDLLNNFATRVLATDLSVDTMEEGGELFQRVLAMNEMSDTQGTAVINKDSEEISVVAAPLGGVKDLVGQSQEHMTTPSQIPIVKFFGNQPSGLNADSEGVIRLFYDRVKALQEGLIREPIQTIVNLVMIELWGEVDDDIQFDFVELWQLDEAGKSAIQKTRADQRAVDIEAGVVIAEEARLALARDKDSQYAGLDLHEPLPEPDPMEMFGPGEGEQRGESQQGPAQPSRRDLGGMTSAAARAGGGLKGGAVTGGFDAVGRVGGGFRGTPATAGSGAAHDGRPETSDGIPVLTPSDFDYQPIV